MGLREQVGGMVEGLLNEAIDEHLSADKLKEELGKLIDGKFAELKEKLKANIIDKLDGEDDIADV